MIPGVRQTAIPCACGCSIVMLWEFEQWDDEPRHIIADWSVSYDQGRLRHRVRAALRVLRGRDPWLHSITLQEEGIGQLAAALTGDGGGA